MFDANQMIIFAKVVEAKSFSACARKLGLPKSNISRKIAQLEARLGVRLIERSTRHLNLTEAGIAYYQYCARLADEVELANSKVGQMQSTPSGILRITTPVIWGDSYLGKILPRFYKKYDNIKVEAVLENRKVNLLEEEIDVAIRLGPLDDSSYIAQKLWNTNNVLCASPHYLTRFGTPLCPQELTGHQGVLRLQQSGSSPWQFRRSTQNQKYKIDVCLNTNSFFVMLDAVIQGMGIALLPDFLCAEEQKKGNVQAILQDWTPMSGDFYAVYPSRRYLSEKVKVFLAFLKNDCGMFA